MAQKPPYCPDRAAQTQIPCQTCWWATSASLATCIYLCIIPADGAEWLRQDHLAGLAGGPQECWCLRRHHVVRQPGTFGRGGRTWLFARMHGHHANLQLGAPSSNGRMWQYARARERVHQAFSSKVCLAAVSLCVQITVHGHHCNSSLLLCAHSINV